MRKGRIYCPVNGWDCPYYRDECVCVLNDPMADCDDFALVWSEEDDYWSGEPETEYEIEP